MTPSEVVDTLEADELPAGLAREPVAVRPGTSVREDVVVARGEDAVWSSDTLTATNRWRAWHASYDGRWIEFEDPEGETVEIPLENSYSDAYAERYCARNHDLERAVEREFDDPTTAMVTFTGSSGRPGNRPPLADHLREVARGLSAALGVLREALAGERWVYVVAWEPHKSGYGHLHLGVFLDGVDANAKAFKPVMDEHVENCKLAGYDAHHNSPCEKHAGEGVNDWDSADPECDDCDNPVSINDDVSGIGDYLTEYMGLYGADPLEADPHVQTFYAACWATGTQRVRYSVEANEMIDREYRRRRREELGFDPEDRGGDDGGNGGWTATVAGRARVDPISGETRVSTSTVIEDPPDPMTEIDGPPPGYDPPDYDALGD